MKEYPINFKTNEVIAILNGRKTQMRMIIKPQPKPQPACAKIWSIEDGTWCWESKSSKSDIFTPEKFKPDYQIADRLWVREPWQVWVDYNGLSSRELPQLIDVLYIADRPDSLWDSRKRRADSMPRWASRITLEITNVRVERVKYVSEVDAVAKSFEYDLQDGWVWVYDFEVVNERD